MAKCSKCDQESLLSGMCNKHYRRELKARRGVRTRPTVDMSISEKIDHYSELNIENGCIEWTGALNDKGYGNVKVGKATKPAHRVAYALAVGPIPDGLYLLHTCDNPKCINPAHLKPGTQADNMQDMYSKGRQPDRGRGEENPLSKLTADKVLAIRSDTRRYVEIASDYGICVSNVGAIKSRLTWTHLPDVQL